MASINCNFYVHKLQLYYFAITVLFQLCSKLAVAIHAGGYNLVDICD